MSKKNTYKNNFKTVQRKKTHKIIKFEVIAAKPNDIIDMAHALHVIN